MVLKSSLTKTMYRKPITMVMATTRAMMRATALPLTFSRLGLS